MADAESIKKEIDTINTNDKIEVQEMEEFLKSEDNIKKLGEIMNSETSPQLVEEMENVIKDLCIKLLSQASLTENQENIFNYIIENYGDKYPELEESIKEKQIFILNKKIEEELYSVPTNYLTNLQELGIDTSFQNNKKKQGILWNNIIKDIKNPNDLQTIDENNIIQYLTIPDSISHDNYKYIAENLRNILYTHIQLNPSWKSMLQNGGLSIGRSLDNIQQDDSYLRNLYQTLQTLSTKDINQQVEYITKGLPNNSDLLDLWIKRNVNNDNQEAILTNIFDKISPEHSDKFFQTCEKNKFINELKNNYVLYRLNKNNSINTDDKTYCFLNWQNKSDFDYFYGKGIKLSEGLSFDELYEHSKNFYTELGKFGIDATIPIQDIVAFNKKRENFCINKSKYEKQYENQVHENNNPYTDALGQGYSNAAHKSIRDEKINEISIKLEEEYAKLLLLKKPRPKGRILGMSGIGVYLDFSKGNNPEDIVRNSFREQLGDQWEKFKHDLKNDRQAAFGSAMGMIGGIAGSAVIATFTGNIRATSAGFTAGLRLGNGIGQELWNSGEFLYEQATGKTINDGNNKVEKFGQGFLRGVGALDQNYEYVGTAKFISGLGFDYLSNVATFGLSQKFGGFLGKLEGIKFAGGALKFGMEELILENFFVDIPMNIVQTGFETFTGIDDGVTIGNTAIGNQHTVEGQWGYKSGSLSDMLRAMKDATTQNLSFENLSQTFFNTIIYGGLLEGGGAAIKKMKGYLPAGQVSNFTERSAAASIAFEGLTDFMSSKNIRFDKDGSCIDTKTNLKIEESDPRFKELISHIKAVEATKAGVIESFETIMETQKQMVSDPESRTGLLFRLGLISPTNTPFNILNKKKQLVEKKLSDAKAKGDNNKVNQLQKLLDIYTDAETKLTHNITTEGISEMGQYSSKISESYNNFLNNNPEINSGKFEFVGKNIEELYKKGLETVLEGKTESEYQTIITNYNSEFLNNLQTLYKKMEENYTKFMDSNPEIQTKIESGKFEFMGKDIKELYKKGLKTTLEGKPDSQHESLIFDFNTRFANSLEFLSDKESTVKYLDSKTGELVLGTITDYGKNLLGENFESSPTKKAFFDKLKISMFYQHLDNPLKYCSHGADHSILVDRYVQNIIESYPDVVNSVKEKYGVNEEGAKQLLRLTAVFHDFGYPDIGDLAKAMHGPFGGAHFINEYASSSNSTFVDFIKNDLGITDQTTIGQLINDMRDAIFFHSADKVEKGYLNKITYTKGSFLLGSDLEAKGTNDFIEILNRESDGAMTITYRSEDGRKNAEDFKKKILEKYPNLDGDKIKIEEDTNSYSYDYDEDVKKETDDGKKYAGRKGKVGDIGIEFQPIDLLTDPLAGIVRLADNMDMSMDRLTKVQSHPIFMNLFYNIGYIYESITGHPSEGTASYIYQQMEKLNNLDEKKQVSQEEYDKMNDKKKKDYITPEKYREEYDRISTKIQQLIDQANDNGGIEMTIFDEKTGKPKEGGKFRAEFEGKILKDGKVDLFGYKQFIINEMSKQMDSMGIKYDHDSIQIIQNIAIDSQISSYSFRHFIGLTPIKDVTIESKGTGERTLIIKVNKDIYLDPNLWSQKITEGTFVGRPVVEYHIWRLYDASGRVTVNNDLLGIKIIDENTGTTIGEASRITAKDNMEIKYNVDTPDTKVDTSNSPEMQDIDG